MKPTIQPTPLCCRISPGSLSVYQPEGLDFPALLKQAGLEGRWGSRKMLHKLQFIVHCVIERTHRDARSNDVSNPYAFLNSAKLRKFTGAEDTAQALKHLVEPLRVLEKNPKKYSALHFSCSFRLAPQYQAQAVRVVELNNATLARRISEEHEARNLESIASNPASSAVLSGLRLLTISNDVHQHAEEVGTSARAAAWKMSINDLAQQRLWITADEKTGRIFHNVTQFPKELRKHLRISGEELVEVDIAGAQFFFLLSLYRSQGGPEHERSRFVHALTCGDFYQTIFEGCSNRTQWGGKVEVWRSNFRDDFKKRVIGKVLYSRSDWPESTEVFDSFAELFPWLAGELALQRVGTGARDLALCMQKKEADLILGAAIPRILSELPGCRPISLHDAILCQEQFGHDVRQIVQEEAAKMFGAVPLVRLRAA